MELPCLSGTDQQPPDRGSPAEAPTVDEASLAAEGLGPRYARKAFHAQGGIGEVWLCLDAHLGREIALKVLRRDGEDARVRFVAEAQITGQLEHPNIVPVHDVGLDDAQRPYYVMKFVRGTTLKHAIGEYHAMKGPMAGARRVKWVRLLQIFIDVCHAIAYAHSRRVIHRDLKPANVMLGSYGETLVVDWGVAKVLGQQVDGGGKADTAPVGGDVSRSHTRPSVLLRSIASGSAVTSEGTVLGTPAYMAPEMVAGHPEALNELTDVFLLGATLYEILTGEPPRRGKSHDEIVEMVRNIPPLPARRIQPNCPKALEAIAAKAMAMRPGNRYSAAMELAVDMQRYLADEPVSVCAESLPVRFWRWSRRHRVGLVRSAAALAMLIGSLVAVMAVKHAQEQQRIEQTKRVAAEREAAIFKEQQRAGADLVEFLRLAEDARYLAANSDAPSEHAPYFDLNSGQQMAEEALAIAARWHDGVSGWPLASEPGGNLRQEVYSLILLMAQIRSTRGEDQAATLQLLARAKAAAPLDTVTRAYHRILADLHRVTAPARAAEEDRLAELGSIPDVEGSFLTGERFRLQTAALAADNRRRAELLEQAMRSYREALRHDPRHYWCHFQIGRCLLAVGRAEEAIAELGACIALRPDKPWAYSARGLAFALTQRFNEAKADLDRALAIRPDFRPALLNRAVCSRLQQDLKSAMRDFDAALAPPASSRLVEAAYYRAQVYFQTGQYPLAIADLTLVDAERPALSQALSLRAQARLMLNDVNGFWSDLDAFASKEIRIEDDVRVDPRVARIHTLAMLRKTWLLPRPNAASVCRLALKSAVQLPPQHETAAFLGDEGSLAANVLRDHEQAVRFYTASLNMKPDGIFHQLRGQSHFELGHLKEAEEDFAAAAQILEAAKPERPIQAATAHAYLGIVLAREGRTEIAIDEASKAVTLAGGEVTVLHNIACVYAEASEKDPMRVDAYQQLAKMFLRKAIRIWRDYPKTSNYDEVLQIQADPSLHSVRERPDYKEWFREARL